MATTSRRRVTEHPKPKEKEKDIVKELLEKRAHVSAQEQVAIDKQLLELQSK